VNTTAPDPPSRHRSRQIDSPGSKRAPNVRFEILVSSHGASEDLLTRQATAARRILQWFDQHPADGGEPR